MNRIGCHRFTQAELRSNSRFRLANHIAQRRVELRMTQGELGRRVRLSRTSITNVELGNQGIIADELPRWAKALNWSVRQLARGLEP